MAKTIPLLDLMFFLSETKANPKHVAALILLEAPVGAGKDFVAKLAASYRKAVPRAPFDKVAQFGLTHLPRWVDTGEFDMEYHVRHTVLPRGATKAQLLAHVAQTHEQLLDRAQPVFQAEFIEGLPERRFAVYLKIHHALVDGASAIARVLASLGETPATRAADPFFAVRVGDDAPQQRKARASTAAAIKNLILKQGVAGGDLALKLLRKQFGGSAKGAGSAPFSAPRGPMNDPMVGTRSIALLSLPIDEMKAAGKAFGGTLNDVAVTVVDAALTRYLRGRRKATGRRLVAMCPVSLREAGDKEATTKVSAIFVPLGAPGMKIGPRMEQVIASAGSAKEELGRMSKDAAMMYAIAAFGLSEISELTRLDTVVRPLANFVLSNVPGSRTERYLGRAKVLGMYPVSALGAGIGLNVTLLSYGNSMDFGFVANGASMPDLDTVANYTRAAFVELCKAAVKRERAAR
jgi:diacylglycerol O-acyltransferase